MFRLVERYTRPEGKRTCRQLTAHYGCSKDWQTTSESSRRPFHLNISHRFARPISHLAVLDLQVESLDAVFVRPSTRDLQNIPSWGSNTGRSLEQTPLGKKFGTTNPHEDIYSGANRISRLVAYKPETADPRKYSARLLRAIFKVPTANLEEKRQLLRVFNAFTARLQTVGTSLNRSLIEQGLYQASDAQSISSLEVYTELALEFNIKLEWSRFTERILANLYRWAREVSFNGSPELRRKNALSTLLIPQADTSNSEELSAPSWDLWSVFDTMHDNIRRRQISIIIELGGGTVAIGYLEYLKQDLRQRSVALDKSHPDCLGYRTAVNDTMKALIHKGFPELAWKLLHDLDWDVDDYRKDVWALLLDHPDHISQWKAGMDVPVVRKYEEYLQKVEEIFGVRWTGGENGIHVPAGEDMDDYEAEYRDIDGEAIWEAFEEEESQQKTG